MNGFKIIQPNEGE